MPLKRQQRIVVHHPAAIVDHPDHPLAAHFCFNADRIRACIQRIFQQLIHHRSRALHNLSCRDFIRQRLRQYAYPAHDFLLAIPN